MARRKELILEKVPSAPGAAGIDELGNGGKNWRGAAGGKIPDGRTENGNFNGWDCLNQSQQHCNRDISGCGIHLPVGKQGDGALMLSIAGIRVKPFVQCRRGRHRVEQQDNSRQHRGDDRLAASRELARYEPHNKTKLTDIMPRASGFDVHYTSASSR